MKTSKLLKFSATICLVVSIALLAALSIKPGHSGAASASNWKANRIIDDYNFYNGSTMSDASIQNFLNAKVPVCDTNGELEYNGTGMTRAEWAEANNRPEPPYICLKSYTQKIPSRAADSFCPGSVSSGTKKASLIIYEVAKACNISPKVLLVTLQKEQSLITDDWPWPVQYQKAMGYGCPDTAGCDPDFAGFFNQVWYAARQFQRYKIQPQNFNYRAGKTSFVRYNPSSSCGGTNLNMYNHATAGLYNYTPYQPNSAALANLYGTGNACSAYGNRNFWRMYTDWFGNPLIDPAKDHPFVGDWDGDGESTPAVRRGTTYLFDNDNDGEADATVSWGRTTDVAIAGDWDGDGRDEVGLKRGYKYFLDSNQDGRAEITLAFGKTTDGVLVGDWDGDGRDEIGLKRDNKFFLDTDLDGSAEITLVFGKSTDSPLVGDWDGDGRDEVGLKRGYKYFLDSNQDGRAEITLAFGKTTDGVLVGDWDGDGRDEIGLRRSTTYFLDNNHVGRADVTISWGKTTDVAIAGDWDGDGADELGLKRSSTYYLDFNNDGTQDSSFLYTY